MISIILSILSACNFAVANTISSKTGTLFPPYINLYYRYIITVTCFLLAFLVSLIWSPIISFDISALSYVFGIGIFAFLGLLSYFKSFATAPVGLSITVVNTSIIFTVITNYVVNKQTINIVQIASIIISLLGIYFITKKDENNSKKLSGLWFALLTSFLWGVAFTFYRSSIPAGGVFAVGFFIDLIGLTVLGVLLQLTRKRLPPLAAIFESNNTFFLYSIIALASTIGVYSRIFAQTLGNISIIEAIITCITPIFGLIISRIWLNEKLSISQYFGVFITLLGVLGVILG
jgi:drug/metabolite transporter (DMT)-like permease